MKLLLSALIMSVLCAPMWAAADPDVSAYSIPADAVKLGPGTTRNPRVEEYEYYEARTNFDPAVFVKRNSLLALEEYIGEVLVKRELFKNGQLHGVQREWYDNGHLKSEFPYKDGLMDGIFKIWNTQQQLVAQYGMKSGTGTRRVYFDDGRLSSQEEFKNNEHNGLTMQWYDNGQLWSRGLFLEGWPNGLWLYFNEDGSLDSIGWSKEVATIRKYRSPNEFTGVNIKFTPQGAIESKRWSLRSDVDEQTYAEVAAKDPTLPVYYADARQYKKLVTPELQELIKHYRTLPPIKIPLKLDAQSNPILAPTAKAAKP